MGVHGAGRWVLRAQVALPLDQVRRVAATGYSARAVTVRLLQLVLQTPTAEKFGTLTALGEPYSPSATTCLIG